MCHKARHELLPFIRPAPATGAGPNTCGTARLKNVIGMIRPGCGVGMSACRSRGFRLSCRLSARCPVWGVRTFFTVIQGHAFGAPTARPRQAPSVRREDHRTGIRGSSGGFRRWRHVGSGNTRRWWAAAWPAASSAAAHRRGPLPQRGLPRPATAASTRRHAPPWSRARKSGRDVLPRRASCRRESSRSRARPAASVPPLRSGQTLDSELPRQDRHLSGGRGSIG